MSRCFRDQIKIFLHWTTIAATFSYIQYFTQFKKFICVYFQVQITKKLGLQTNSPKILKGRKHEVKEIQIVKLFVIVIVLLFHTPLLQFSASLKLLFLADIQHLRVNNWCGCWCFKIKYIALALKEQWR